MDQSTPTQEPYRFEIGAFGATVVSDGVVPFPDDIIAFTPPRREVDGALRDAGIEGGVAHLDTNVLALDTGAGDGLVLVDAGAGGSFPGTGRLLAGLRAAGIEPADVGAVIVTHAHGDHIGGLLDEGGEAVFPNARHLLSRREWDFWTAEPPLLELALDDAFREWFRAASRAILPALGERLELFGFGEEIVPGITALEAAGHTPGQAALEIRSGGERLLLLADAAVHSVVHLRRPDWFGRGDNWPARTVTTRRELLGRAAAEGIPTMAYHFPFPGVGRVREGGEGGEFAWEPAG